VEKREVRHCNWVRFLQATTNMNDVNVIARRVNKQPQFQVIKPLPVHAELKVCSHSADLVHITTLSLDVLVMQCRHYLRQDVLRSIVFVCLFVCQHVCSFVNIRSSVALAVVSPGGGCAPRASF